MDTLRSGHVVGGRYRVEELLGRGGFGAVYRATQLGADRPVALKVLARELVAEPTAMQRFGREAELVQRLAHPNAVTLFDYGSDDEGVPFIAFELLRGQPLDALLRGGPMPVARVARLAAQALRALSAAHALGIVHRDVKPSNLFVCDYPGQPDFLKVLDFGIAKVPSPAGATTQGLTREGHVLGTPSYMAPEQVRQESVGAPADLYALGLVISEALAGRSVFGEGSGIQICMAQIADKPAPHAGAVLDSPLGRVVAKATEKNPSLRYASASEMLADLEAAVPEARPGFVGGPAAIHTAAAATAAQPAPHTVAAAPAHAGGFVPGPAVGLAARELAAHAAPSSGPSMVTLALAAAGLVAATALVTAVVLLSWNRDTSAVTTAPDSPGDAGAPATTSPAGAVVTGTPTARPGPGPVDPLTPAPTPTVPARPTISVAPFPGPAPTPTPTAKPPPTVTVTVPKPTTTVPAPKPTSTSKPTCNCAPGDLTCAMKCSAK